MSSRQLWDQMYKLVDDGHKWLDTNGPGDAPSDGADIHLDLCYFLADYYGLWSEAVIDVNGYRIASFPSWLSWVAEGIIADHVPEAEAEA